ncbi:hypothetical protein [Nonomuraea sp. NPDC050786]
MKGQRQITKRAKRARGSQAGPVDPGAGIDRRTPSGRETKN